MNQSLFGNQIEMLDRARLMRVSGRIVEISGLTVVAEGLDLPIGASCVIEPAHREQVAAQVVGFCGGRTVLMPMSDPVGTSPGDRVTSSSSLESIGVSHHLLGRVLDGLGRPMDGKGRIPTDRYYPVYADPPPALSRKPIDRPVVTGIRSMDALLTVGCGQRMGLFAGTGVGKSVLMGMIARFTTADINVIALVGERGREVGDFIRKELDDDALARTVMVVSTSDESPVLRVRASFVATAVAEYFRDEGNDVLLLVDSTTRLAMAQRQIGLAAGEPPTTKGYPPSVFALLPQLFERAGRTDRGSITGLYTVLVEGDDINEPISDATRGVLDGHAWLSRTLSNAGHYPAISILESVSRVMVDIVDAEQRNAARALRRLLAIWADIEDLVNIGAYTRGTNAAFDVAIEMKPIIDEFLCQDMNERALAEDTRNGLIALHARIVDAERRAEALIDQPSEGGSTRQGLSGAVTGSEAA